jgi:hypothetical protein
MRALNLNFMKFALMALLLAPLFFSGCSTARDVTSYRNPISGRRTDVLGDNLLPGPEQAREMIWLNAYRDFLNLNEYRYYLEVIYGANEQVGYLDIGPGRTLTIVADGNEMNFTSLGSLDKEKEGHAVYEKVRYDATSDDIARIANAKNVTVRVSGQNGIVVRQFSEENSRNFKTFFEQSSGE